MFRKTRLGLLTFIASMAIATSATLFFVHSPAHAADCGGVTTSVVDCASANDQTGSSVVAVLVIAIQILTGVIGLTAIAMLIYAGILYTSASGNVQQTSKAKEIIRNTVLGLILFAAIAVVLNYLIPGGVFDGTVKFGAGGNGKSNITLSPLGSVSSISDPSNDTSEIVSTDPYDLTLASWNSYVDNKDSKGATAKSILATADILGAQEVHKTAQRESIKSIESSTIGVWFATSKMTGGSSSASYPIIYNKKKLAFVSGGYKLIGKTAGLSERYVAYARFRIKTTGQEFYFANTHLPPGVEAGGKPKTTSTTASYKNQMPVLVSTLKQLEAKSVPVFLVGDFNVNFRREDCTVTWFPCRALRGANMKSAFEITRLAGLPSSLGTHGRDGRLIDYVFVSNDSRVTVNAVAILGSASCVSRAPDLNCYHGSDHRPSLARVTITASQLQSPGHSSPSPSSPSTSLSGVKNFRDLAKLNANIIKPGVVYRSAKLENATASDRSKLANMLKNGVIIDLRTASKRASAPDKTITGVPNLNYDVDAASDAASYVKIFVNDKSERLEFGKAITKIANTEGAVLFHCTAGKDRTGWLAAMLMYIMGADDKQVMTEYLKSRDAGSDFNVEKSWLNAALSAARKNNGNSIMKYIQSTDKGLGVSDATIAKLKAKLGK